MKKPYAAGLRPDRRPHCQNREGKAQQRGTGDGQRQIGGPAAEAREAAGPGGGEAFGQRHDGQNTAKSSKPDRRLMRQQEWAHAT